MVHKILEKSQRHPIGFLRNEVIYIHAQSNNKIIFKDGAVMAKKVFSLLFLGG